jgi:ADP-heptose:LPS heptosyltransferase
MAELGDLSVSPFAGLDRLGELFDNLNTLRFDCVVNLTHTKLSGHICGVVECPVKVGLEISDSGDVKVHGNWFRFLDERNHRLMTLFHHIDIFKHAVGLKDLPVKCTLHTTNEAEERAEEFFKGLAKTVILVQLTTSDPKKEWSGKEWKKTIAFMAMLQPHCHFVIITSPGEHSRIGSWVDELRAEGLPVECQCLSLPEVLSFCKRGDLLLTGDTSIKHIASCTDIPILEIALGSANVRELGTYRKNSWILSPRVKCYPCRHSSACTQTTHLCGESLPAEVVAVAAHKILQRVLSELKVLAQEYRDQVVIHEVNEIAGAGWWLHPLLEEPNPDFLRRLLEREAWELSLDQNSEQTLPEHGSRAVRLEKYLRVCFAKTSPHVWLSLTKVVDEDLEAKADKVKNLLWELRGVLCSSKDLKLAREIFSRNLQIRNIKLGHQSFWDDYSMTLKRLCDVKGVCDFTHLRNVSQEISALSSRLDAEKRILRTLRERIVKYEF